MISGNILKKMGIIVGRQALMGAFLLVLFAVPVAQASEKFVEEKHKKEETVSVEGVIYSDQGCWDDITEKAREEVNLLENQLCELVKNDECVKNIIALKQKFTDLVSPFTEKTKHAFFKRAVCCGTFEETKLWIELGRINVNATLGGKGKTALHFAAEDGKVPLVQLLINQKGINTNMQDSEGNTPLHLVVKRAPVAGEYWLSSYEEIIDFLLNSKADIGLRDCCDNTSFALARDGIKFCDWPYWNQEIKKNESLFKLFQAMQATQTEKNKFLLTAAVKNKEIDVKFWLKKGADVNAQTSNGYTPFMLAAENGNKEVCAELYSAGADPKINFFGKSALSLATDNAVKTKDYSLVKQMLAAEVRKKEIDSALNKALFSQEQQLSQERKLNYEAQTLIDQYVGLEEIEETQENKHSEVV